MAQSESYRLRLVARYLRDRGLASRDPRCRDSLMRIADEYDERAELVEPGPDALEDESAIGRAARAIADASPFPR